MERAIFTTCALNYIETKILVVMLDVIHIHFTSLQREHEQILLYRNFEFVASFLDIGLGAYGSGHAVILLSRAVMESEPSLWTVPTTLPRNATNFKCTLCWDMAVFARFRLQR